MNVLSERLRELRGSQSQADMAKPLGIVYQQWAKYERGESAPGSELLAKICRAHACSADWLLGIDKSSVRQNFSTRVSAGAGGVAIGGVGNRVSGVVVAGESPVCSKCPYKKKLRALEKLMQK